MNVSLPQKGQIVSVRAPHEPQAVSLNFSFTPHEWHAHGDLRALISSRLRFLFTIKPLTILSWTFLML